MEKDCQLNDTGRVFYQTMLQGNEVYFRENANIPAIIERTSWINMEKSK